MPYRFKPPTYAVAFTDDDKHLMRFYSFGRGYTVRVNGETVDTYPGVQGILDTDLEDYDYVYQGGRAYEISDAEYATLVASDARWGDHAEAL